MERIAASTAPRLAIVALAAMAICSTASAQSSSMYLRAEQGQVGSNTPTAPAAAATPPATPTPAAQTQPAPAGPQASAGVVIDPAAAAGVGAPVQATETALPGPATATGSSVSALRQPAEPIRAYPLLGNGGRDELTSPSVAALHAVSFIAIAPAAPRNFKTHDLVTIIVREETSFSSDSETDLSKDAAIEAKLEDWIKLRAGNLQIVPTAMALGDPKIKASATRSFEGEGEVKRKDSFIGRITAEVIDVKPNGTLVLAAKKYIKTDDEQQWFEVTGSCRVEDVNADNSVLSTQLADLVVRKVHTGSVRDNSQRGLIPRLVDALNPF